MHAVDQQLLYRQVIDLLGQREETGEIGWNAEAAFRPQASPIEIRFLLKSECLGLYTLFFFSYSTNGIWLCVDWGHIIDRLHVICD